MKLSRIHGVRRSALSTISDMGAHDDRKVDNYVYRGYDNVPRSFDIVDAGTTRVITKSQIASNLFDLLIRIRHPTRFRGLWVDAICINQEDHEERSQQVAIMARDGRDVAKSLPA